MRGEAVTRIEAALLFHRLQLGQLGEVRFYEGLLVGRDVLLERDGLVLGRVLIVAQRGLDLIDGNMQARRNKREVRFQILLLVAQQIAADGRIVVDDDAAFAIKDATARRKNRHLAYAVLLGQYRVAGGAEDLEPPQANTQNEQHQRHHILRGMQLGGREPFFAGDAIEIHADSILRRGGSVAGLEAVQQKKERDADHRVCQRRQ